MLIRPLDHIPDLLAMQSSAPAQFPCLLESVAHGTARARFDLLLAADGTGLRLDRGAGVHALDGRAIAGGFLDALDAHWAAAASNEAPPLGLPFSGGWALFLAYELAGEIEPRLRLPAAAGRLPVALALRCPAAIVVDHVQQRAYAVAEPGEHALLDAIAAASRAAPPPCMPLPAHAWHEDAADGFIDGAGRVLDYLAAGDVFQVNLSRGWHARFDADVDPASLYAALRDANPAPFSGLLRGDGWAIASSSPERLVARRGARIETRPIAGTRARLRDGRDDARIRELVAHPKERAEHIMLIDLERNDLGRVCVPGSVRVDELMAIESYAHVHHIESTVSGMARPGLTAGQLIRAVFPGGTITGCPKVRCMEIVAELERTGRGPYTGALGWLDRSGDLDLNILIRTLWLEGRDLRLRAGAGIVIDSNPAHELGETRAKARGLLRALGRHE